MPRLRGGSPLHLAEIDADAKLHLPVLGECLVPFFERMLDLGRAGQRFAGGGEFGKNRIAGIIDDGAVMGLDGLPSSSSPVKRL